MFLLFHPVFFFLPFFPTAEPGPRLYKQQTTCLVQSAKDGTKLPLMRNSAEILVEYDLRMRNDWPVKKGIVDFQVMFTANSKFVRYFVESVGGPEQGYRRYLGGVANQG